MMLEALPNRQVKTIKEKVWTICNLYECRGFDMDSIYADSEFELLRPDFPFINTSDADDHQPDIERAIRTVKDWVRSTYHMLPYKYIPQLMVSVGTRPFARDWTVARAIAGDPIR